MTTPAQLLTEHFDIWAAAVAAKSAAGRGSKHNLELYGLKKLRELILELAVRGLLAPQDPRDEPAAVLLKKIAAEKARLLKEGKIEQQKKFPPINEDEKPFELPRGWEWCRLGELGVMAQGGTPSKSVGEYWGGTIPFITGADIKEKYVSKARSFVTEKGFNSSKTQKCQKGDLLIVSRTGVGRFGIAATDLCISQDVTVLSPFSETNVEYSIIFLKAATEKIKSASQGLTIQGITRGFIENLLTPFPPLAEQRRIVAKVDELMALCDRLEQQQDANIAAHQTLVRVLLAALTAAAERGAFEAAWTRIADHFDALFTTAESIAELKQTILQLAVMGKLVPQNPADEPASALLKKIAAEKAKLVKAGKIKKQEPLPPIREDEQPFKLPNGWEWTRLSTALKKIADGTHLSPPNSEKGDFLYISAKNIKPEGVLLSNVTYVTKEVHEEIYSRCDPEKGDLLYIKDGATTGIVTINDLAEPFSMLSSVALLKSTQEIFNKYLLIALTAPYFYNEMRANMTGVAITRVTLKKLNEAVIALPPLAEQRRIVAKVDELMALCDRLHARLAASQTTQRQLADAIAARNFLR